MCFDTCRVVVGGGMLKIFLLVTTGQFIMYQVLFWIIDGAAGKKIFFWQFDSLLWYTCAATLFGFSATFFGAWLMNYALVLQALSHEENLWYGQFVVWASAPILFTLLSKFQRNIPFDTRTIISLGLLFLAMVVRQSK